MSVSVGGGAALHGNGAPATGNSAFAHGKGVAIGNNGPPALIGFVYLPNAGLHGRMQSSVIRVDGSP